MSKGSNFTWGYRELAAQKNHRTKHTFKLQSPHLIVSIFGMNCMHLLHRSPPDALTNSFAS